MIARDLKLKILEDLLKLIYRKTKWINKNKNLFKYKQTLLFKKLTNRKIVALILSNNVLYALIS
jgi:hypothetical protein